jgi:hypothetical protein
MLDHRGHRDAEGYVLGSAEDDAESSLRPIRWPGRNSFICTVSYFRLLFFVYYPHLAATSTEAVSLEVVFPGM